jgi:large subunit ribosomal protein L24
MISSAQPRKQRLFRFTAPMHDRQKFVHAHISKELAAKLGIKKRNIGVRKGDIVKIMSGKNKGKSGKVTNVDLKKAAVLVEGIFRKNAKGKELQIAISASNVYLTELDLTDKLRSAAIEAAKAKK